jgi:hypothetical protein
MNHVAENRAMIWLDATKPSANSAPLTVLAFRSVRGPDSLSIYANQPIFDIVAPEIPHNLTMSMNRWLRSRTKKQDGGPVRQVNFYTPSNDSDAPALFKIGIKSDRTVLNVAVAATNLP